MEIIVGGRGDVADINGLYRSAGWAEPGSIRSRDHYVLARVDRHLVGAALFWIEVADDLPDVWVDRFGRVDRLTVHEIVVALSHRRRGIGRLLMVAIARAALDRGVPYLWAWPSPRGNENEVGGRLKFFESCAMDILAEDPDHVVAVGRADVVKRCGSDERAGRGGHLEADEDRSD